jgi:hypothetical protein
MSSFLFYFILFNYIKFYIPILIIKKEKVASDKPVVSAAAEPKKSASKKTVASKKATARTASRSASPAPRSSKKSNRVRFCF